MINLGTPDAAETSAVRRYLAQFLSDPRIIEMNRILWRTILHGIILRIRPSRSAKAYQEVWSETEGSPLLSNSIKQKTALQNELNARFATDIVVKLAMRYGQPSIDTALQEMEEQGVQRLIVLPMYPQYSGTTTASVFDAVAQRLQRTRWLPEFRFITQYVDEPKFIEALANSVRRSWKQNGQAELLVTSYHGIPQRYLHSGDPYHCQCYKTTRLLTEELDLKPEQVKVVFQSRVGREEWLRPYCDETLKQLPAEGHSSIDIMCPGFAADCLETLEEIDGENREYFEENGGKVFNYIPCLNDDETHIHALADLIQRHAQGWPEADPYFDTAAQQIENEASAQRAEVLLATPGSNAAKV